MDIEQLWEKAQSRTEVIRSRVQGLSSFESTRVPYIFLAESAIHDENTVVRKGRVFIERPLILLPEDMPQFEGFDLEEELHIEQGALTMFFLMRGIRFPSLKYHHALTKLDLEETALSKSIEKYKKDLEKQENVNTALIIGPEDCWQFSVIIYMASLIGRCARNDIMNLMDKFREGRGKS